MTRFTITDTAAQTTIATGADRWDAAEALRGAYLDAPTEVAEAVESAAEAIEAGGCPTDAECAYLAIEIEVA